MPLIKKAIKPIWAFICKQYLILFFILTIGIKLFYINTFILEVVWPTNQYQSGVLFGFLTTALIFSPLYFTNKNKNKKTIILALLVSVLLSVDVIYFSYFSALPTVGLISSLNQAKDVGPAIVDLLKWWFVLYFIDIAFVVLFKKHIKSFFDGQNNKHPSMKSGFNASGLALIVTIIAFWLGMLPIGVNKLAEVIDKGYDTKSTAQYYGVLTAHVIDVIRFIEQETISLSTAQEKDLSNWVKDNKPTQATSNFNGVAKNKNIIMIQVESLGGFVINQKINNKEITPNLNKLSQNSQFFPNNNFIIGAGHTSDADFVMNTSYFPLPDAAIFVRYGQDDFTSLPKTLIANNYSAYVYHGFNRNFWNRNIALSSLGYQKFYAADNYSKSTKINMGLNDGDFLSETAEYIKNQPKPSFSYVITLSSHVPFSITKETKELGINTNDYPNQVGGYLENINYVDRMLGKFFDKLKAMKLYDDSLIVVYGDHVPVLTKFTAGNISYDPDGVQGKEVPLLIKLPNNTDNKTYPNTGTSLDIMPTVLDLAGINTSQLMFGRDLLSETSKDFEICSNQIATFKILGNCKDALVIEQNKSSKIIRYNQFNNLPK